MTFNLRKIMSDTSGGAYFFLDSRDRAVLVDSNNVVRVIAQEFTEGVADLVEDARFDLSPYLSLETGAEDVVTAILPDWDGYYWFTSRDGVIGVIEPSFGKAHVLNLMGESIQNAFAVDKEGVYVVSDNALYGLRRSNDGGPEVVWREAYELSSEKKPGAITLGSGTTPTLIRDRYVAIADNSDPRINVLVFKRGHDVNGHRLICKVPVFEPGKSATENTLVGIGNSVVVENNYGYDLFPTMMFGRTSAGGVARVDIDPNSETCSLRWSVPLVSQTTVPKVSAETGLLYLYTKSTTAGRWIDAYYLTGVDLETGDVEFQILTGTGVSYDNNWAPITIGPENCLYIGVLRGLVEVCDSTV